MKGNCSTLVLAIVFLCPPDCLGQAADSDSSSEIQPFINGLKKTEERIRTLSVTFNSRRDQRLPALFAATIRTSSTRSIFDETWHIDSDGRGWNRAAGKRVTTDTDGRERELQIDHHATFDGKDGRLRSIETSENGQANQRGSVQPALIRQGVSPLEFTTHYHGVLISKLLQQRGGKLLGQQEWDDHDVTVIELEPAENNLEYKSELWIDRKRDYVVVRRRDLIRLAPQTTWHVTRSVDAFGHEQVADGVWLPKIAWTRSFDPPLDGQKDGRINNSYKAICSQWKVNETIPDDQLTLEFPPGLRVRGMLEAFQAKQKEKLRSFFIEPVTTDLQRKYVGANTDVYATIDVTAYVDVNSNQISPAKFDFEAFKARLVALRAEVKGGSLYLHFDFGAIGTDNILGTFVREPVTAICKQAGFNNVRQSNTYHNDGRLWKQPAGDGDPAGTESNLGDARLEVFPVVTPLSRHLTKGTDYLIELKESLGIESTQLLDEKSRQTLTDALIDEQLDGQSVHIKFTVGKQNARHPGAEDLPHVKDNSELQMAVVKFLRSTGFGDIHMVVKNGFTNFTSDYLHDR